MNDAAMNDTVTLSRADYEALLDRLEDLEDIEDAKKRKNEPVLSFSDLIKEFQADGLL